MGQLFFHKESLHEISRPLHARFKSYLRQIKGRPTHTRTDKLKAICPTIKRHKNQPHLSQHMRLWYLSPWRPAKAQTSLRISAVSPEPSLFAHMKYGRRRRVRPKIRHLAPLDGYACALEERVYGGRKVP